MSEDACIHDSCQESLRQSCISSSFPHCPAIAVSPKAHRLTACIASYQAMRREVQNMRNHIPEHAEHATAASQMQQNGRIHKKRCGRRPAEGKDFQPAWVVWGMLPTGSRIMRRGWLRTKSKVRQTHDLLVRDAFIIAPVGFDKGLHICTLCGQISAVTSLCRNSCLISIYLLRIFTSKRKSNKLHSLA